MKLGIMQPYFFPYIGYFQLLNLVDTYVLFDDVNFIKRGWINRNRILCNGKPAYINVPLSGMSQNKKILEIEVDSGSALRSKTLRTIEENYKHAPYFNDVFPIVSELITCEERNLGLYLENSIRKICNYLGIDTNIIRSSDMQKNNDLHGENKILDICQRLGTDEYYNAIGGMQLYHRDRFEELGISLFFLQCNEIIYPQFKFEFTPSLSIIDVMMFCKAKDIEEMLQCYTLV